MRSYNVLPGCFDECAAAAAALATAQMSWDHVAFAQPWCVAWSMKKH
jgi:hypothetical protein